MAQFESKSQRDPLSPLARDVLALFRDVLAEVHFPDLDLARLEAATEALWMAQRKTERLEAELEAARAELTAESTALTAQCQRALAYARVFAEADPALAARVAELGPPASHPPTRTTEPKRRGRPRKGESDASLFSSARAEPEYEATPSVSSAEHAA